MGRYQQGHIYEAFGAFHVRFYQTEFVEGQPKRLQKSHKLCDKDDKHYSRTCKTVRLKCDEFMAKINAQQPNSATQQDMRIVDFWEQRYLPYCEEIVQLTKEPRKKPSTVRGYKQIWNQRLKAHFGSLTLQQYEPYMGTQFLQSLTSTQGRTTLKHIKALGSSLFKRAVIEQRIKVNPWHDVEMPEDAIEPERTQHYTLEEAENLISALVDYVDCQLILALSCFLGLRPGEIAALKWEDIDTDRGWIHIRRSVVRGIVSSPKTLEAMAPVPLIDQVRVPLELWRQKSGNRSEGYVFESRNGTPTDLHNAINRIIKPTVEAKGLKWKTLYAGRRGACTLAVEATNGNYAVAQALLRHKSMTTTLNVYKKQITPAAFEKGMKLLEAAVAANGNGKAKKKPAKKPEAVAVAAGDGNDPEI